MKKRILVSTCAVCCLLALAGCGATNADNKATTESVESTVSAGTTETAGTIESTVSAETTETAGTIESTASTETMESSEAGEAKAWADGTYTETATGKDSNFEVTVEIQDGKIASVTIGEHNEAPDKGGIAIAQLPDKIVEAQSYDVDVVTGATVTSTGIKDAVAKALEKAAQ